MPPPLKKTYLTLYNTLNATLWTTILFRTCQTLKSTNGDVTAIYPTVGDLTKWTQTVILFDVLHALFGLVRTSLPTVIFQAYSRLFIVWAILPHGPTPTLTSPTDSLLSSPFHLFHTTMLISWSIAEITRYTYYVFSAYGGAPGWLVWLRYNLFFVLYVTGAGSEWLCMWFGLGEFKRLREEEGGKGAKESVGWEGIVERWGYWWVVGMLVIWPILFPNQYLHMMALRRKMMRGKKKA